MAKELEKSVSIPYTFTFLWRPISCNKTANINVNKITFVRPRQSVQCHHVFDTSYVAPVLRGHVTS